MDFFKQVISDFEVLKEKFLNDPLAQKKVCMDSYGWINGWLNEWIDRWMHECT